MQIGLVGTFVKQPETGVSNGIYIMDKLQHKKQGEKTYTKANIFKLMIMDYVVLHLRLTIFSLKFLMQNGYLRHDRELHYHSVIPQPM